MLAIIVSIFLFPSLNAHAAWQWQSAGTVVQDTDPRSLSGGIIIPNPSGLSVGDDLFLVVSYRIGTGSTWSAPSGWTLLSSSTELAVFCRKADSTLVSAGSQQVNGPAAGNSMGFMLRFAGGATGCSPHASTTKNNAGSAQDIATNALTITQPNTLVLVIGLFNWTGGEAGVTSYPGGAINRINVGSSFAANNFSLVAGTMIQTSATSIAAGTIDFVSTNAALSKSIIVSLPAAATDPTGAPTGVTVTPNGTSAPTTMLRVSWGAVTNAHHYRVRYKRTVDSTYMLLPTQFTSLTTDVTGLTPATTYDVQVASANSSESVLLWPASSTQGTTQSPAASAIKFNPGHYVWFTPTLYGTETLATRVNELNSFINSTVCPDSAWQGVMVYAFWSALEGDTQGNYSGTRIYANTSVSIGFNWVDSVLSTLEACGKRLQLVLVDYASEGSNPYAFAFPAYIYAGSVTSQVVGSRTDYRKGCLAYTGQSGGWSGGAGQVVAIWEAACMDHLIALSNAYGDRYNSNPYFEMFEPIANMSYPSDIYTFSNSAFATQTIRMMNEIRPHWPNTALHVWMDYFSSDATHLSVLQAGIAQDFVFGGNDVLPNEDIQADRLFNGETTGTDYRGVVPWVTTVSGPELCGKEGTFTPYQLFNHAFDGNPSIGNGIQGMYPQYYRWLRNTWDCTADGPQRFDTGLTGNYTGTSTSSVLIGTGSKSFTIQTGLAFSPSAYVIIANDANNYMEGTVTSYNSGTGAMVINVLRVTGSGTRANWTIRKEGMTTFIRSINGAIGNGTDTQRRTPASVKSSYCPTGYAGGCY